MKNTGILLTVLVLTLSVLTGCGCRNSKPAETSAPTTMPTMDTTPTTQPTTAPTTMNTEPSVDATIQDGNGPLSTDATTSTDNTTTDQARGRSGSGITGGIGSGNGISGSIS